MKKLKKVHFFEEKEKKSLFLQPVRIDGSLAQLVQSIALTRRGSLVRVQQFPLENKEVMQTWLPFVFELLFPHRLTRG